MLLASFQVPKAHAAIPLYGESIWSSSVDTTGSWEMLDDLYGTLTRNYRDIPFLIKFIADYSELLRKAWPTLSRNLLRFAIEHDACLENRFREVQFLVNLLAKIGCVFSDDDLFAVRDEWVYHDTGRDKSTRKSLTQLATIADTLSQECYGKCKGSICYFYHDEKERRISRRKSLFNGLTVQKWLDKARSLKAKERRKLRY